MKNSDYEKLLVNPNATIKDAMAVIDKAGKGIAFIADDSRRLLGTLTDGDIRRAILRGLPLDGEVRPIMNEHFIFVTKSYTRTLIESIYEQKAIGQIPVLDDKMRIIDIIFYNELHKKPARENWTIIMAGGLGSRLAPLTKDVPKPMLMVGAKPILETIIEQLKSYGFKNIILSLNYKADIIENYFQDGANFGVRIEYIKEKKRLGTAGSIRLAKEHLDKSFFVINGDILTKLNFEQFMNYHTKHKNQITIGTRKYEFQIPYGVVDIKEENVVNLNEKPYLNYFVNGGMYCVEPESVELIPDNEYYDMTQLIGQFINKKKNVGSFPITEYWMDIGQMEDYQQANIDYENLFRGERDGIKE